MAYPVFGHNIEELKRIFYYNEITHLQKVILVKICLGYFHGSKFDPKEYQTTKKKFQEAIKGLIELNILDEKFLIINSNYHTWKLPKYPTEQITNRLKYYENNKQIFRYKYSYHLIADHIIGCSYGDTSFKPYNDYHHLYEKIVPQVLALNVLTADEQGYLHLNPDYNTWLADTENPLVYLSDDNLVSHIGRAYNKKSDSKF